jgi:AraC-like DNA-binding protein
VKRAERFLVQPGWKLLLLDLGLNPAAVLRLADLPADLFARKDASLTPEQYFKLWHGLEEALGPASLPLALGRAMSVEAFDPPIFACLCSPDLNQALQRLSSYKRLIGPMLLAVEIGAQSTRVELSCYGHNSPLPRSLALSEAVFLVQLARLATRSRLTPLQVQLPELPTDCAVHQDFFGCELTRSDTTCLEFSARDALRPFLTENAGMWSFFEGQLNQRLAEMDRTASMRDRVRASLLELLPSGQNSVDEVARRLALSKRSLQRHLNDEGSHFLDILNDTRRHLAEHYLTRSELAPAEISFLLGYRDSNSFQRAFKSWTGATPGGLRRRPAANTPAPDS